MSMAAFPIRIERSFRRYDRNLISTATPGPTTRPKPKANIVRMVYPARCRWRALRNLTAAHGRMTPVATVAKSARCIATPQKTPTDACKLERLSPEIV